MREGRKGGSGEGKEIGKEEQKKGGEGREYWEKGRGRRKAREMTRRNVRREKEEGKGSRKD